MSNPQPAPRYRTREEILSRIDWWTARRNRDAQVARWAAAAALWYRREARNMSGTDMSGSDSARSLLRSAEQAEDEADRLKQTGVVALERLKQKLAEFDTQPMPVIDGSVKKV